MARYEISGISSSAAGGVTGRKILSVLENNGTANDLSVTWYHRPEEGEEAVPAFVVTGESLAEWAAARIRDSSVLIFIDRVPRVFILMAPYAEEYANNMTVLVIDENGRFCVPLLSGRKNEGGEIAGLLERELGIRSVDRAAARSGYDFSVIRFARENNMTMSNIDYAREIMTSLDAGETVGIYTNYRFTGALPAGMEFTDSGEKGIYISPSFHDAFFDRTLWLIPRCMIVDLECPEGTLSHLLLAALDKTFRSLNLFQEAIERIRVPEQFSDDSLLKQFCGDRDILLEASRTEKEKDVYDENGYAYQSICEMESDGGVICRVAMKNIVLSFLG